MDTGPAGSTDSLLDQLDTLVVELAGGVAEPARSGPGRPTLMPSAILWTALVLGVLRGAMSQAAIWRIVTRRSWLGIPRIAVSDQAVYTRLGVAGPSPVGALFRGITTLLVDRLARWQDTTLAPFATEVVVIDETTLEAVPRTLSHLRAVPNNDRRLLPGKLACRFDVRRQLFQRVDLLPDPHQNEKVAAWSMIADLDPGTLVLADLGYFGFRWFDALTERQLWWCSRLRAKTSYTVVHRFVETDLVFDGLVWLGAHRADRTKHLVRLITVQHAKATYRYITNVTDPRLASAQELVRIYGRRWDIELAFKLVKRELGLHLFWSAKPMVVEHQIWAVLLIAQVLHALRVETAGRAGVPVDDVSMRLLVQYLPEYAGSDPTDPIAAFIADGEPLGFIRPASRTRYEVPAIPAHLITLPPPDLVRIRSPRYAGKGGK